MFRTIGCTAGDICIKCRITIEKVRIAECNRKSVIAIGNIDQSFSQTFSCKFRRKRRKKGFMKILKKRSSRDRKFSEIIDYVNYWHCRVNICSFDKKLWFDFSKIFDFLFAPFHKRGHAASSSHTTKGERSTHHHDSSICWLHYGFHCQEHSPQFWTWRRPVLAPSQSRCRHVSVGDVRM